MIIPSTKRSSMVGYDQHFRVQKFRNSKHSFVNFLAIRKQYLVNNGVKLDTTSLHCGHYIIADSVF